MSTLNHEQTGRSYEGVRRELRDSISAAIGKQIRVTFSDTVVQNVRIDAVDDEGFLHSGPDGYDPAHFWTRFEDVRTVDKP